MHKYNIKLEQKDPKMTTIPAIMINNVDDKGNVVSPSPRIELSSPEQFNYDRSTFGRPYFVQTIAYTHNKTNQS